MHTEFSTQLNSRTAELFTAIQAGTVPANSDALNELAELLIAVEDAPVKPAVIARLTVTRANGWKTVVEVEAGSTFHSFFKYYRQFGKKRSTKTLIRTANRSDGGRLQPRLEYIAEKLSVYQSGINPIVRSTIRIFNKPVYHWLMNARPDELGLTQTQRLPIYGPTYVVMPPARKPSGSLGDGDGRMA
jgi:hypothetical protein